MTLSFYLAVKEMWRNRGRFMLFSLVIALITTLVLFVAALAEGLGSGNREYLEKLNGDLVVYKSNVDLSIGASRLDRSKLMALRRLDEVKDAGPISFASVSVMLSNGQTQNAALIGVEPGRPGEPAILSGRGLQNRRSREAIMDRTLAIRTGYKVGDQLTIKVIQGTKEEFYELDVVGLTDNRQYSLQPALIVPDLTWNEIRPGAVGETAQGGATELTSNVVALQLKNPANAAAFAQQLPTLVSDVQAVDRQTAYEAAPGYTAQQSTLNTQQAFALIIGVLVIGGFFQIQTLQKVPQIGMLKAIGAANGIIALASIAQIVLVTIFGVALGSIGTLLLSLTFPAAIPIIFSPSAVAVSVSLLLLIGPIGGLVSIRYSLRVEPLSALGLAS